MAAPKLPLTKVLWGGARPFAQGLSRFPVVDLLIIVGLAGLLFGATRVAGEWTGALRPTVEIDLSPWALPRYTLFSLSRGLIAYVLSLGFTLVYAYWAAKDKVAERILMPLLDVLQSVPVLGFMPGLVLAMVALFPRSNVGLELAAVLMIFTGQAWNMTFSLYHSLRSVPPEQRDVAALYGFSWWQKLRWLELPFATTGLVYNSMMSMAGGWFFLMINEAFVLGDKDFRLPGLGAYMSVASARGDVPAMLWAMLAMVTMIVVLDQLLWRPAVVWAQKFRADEGGSQEAMTSWFYNLLRRSRLVALLQRRGPIKAPHAGVPADAPIAEERASSRYLSFALSAGLVGILGYGLFKVTHVLRVVPGSVWLESLACAALTLGRVLTSTALGTIWALPAGLLIGLTPRLARIVQPIVQVLASFPAPMLFPAVIALLRLLGFRLGVGSIVLMLLGTQWYILFNVIAGAAAIPSDLREAARSYALPLSKRLTAVYIPAVFPYLVTGWVTAAGGAWNASIVAEFVTFRGEVMTTRGLGAQISVAAEHADFPVLAASVALMSLVVIAFNRTVWRRCYRIAEQRFSLNR